MFESLLSWMLAVSTEALDGFISGILGLLSFDLSTFISYFPAAATLYTVIQAVGVGLVLGIAVFQLLKFFAGTLAEQRDTPLQIIVRTVLAIALIYAGNYFLDLCVDMFKYPYTALANFDATEVAKFAGVQDKMTIGEKALEIDMAGAKILLTLCFAIALGLNIVKLLIEAVERWVLMNVMVYTSPLAWATVSSGATTNIFRKWVSMFFGQCILMLLNAWSVMMVLSVMSAQSSSYFFQLVLAFAFCKIAQNLDQYMQTLGIGVGQTGGSLVDEMMAAGKMLSAPFKEGEKMHTKNQKILAAARKTALAGGGRAGAAAGAALATGTTAGAGMSAQEMVKAAAGNIAGKNPATGAATAVAQSLGGITKTADGKMQLSQEAQKQGLSLKSDDSGQYVTGSRAGEFISANADNQSSEINHVLANSVEKMDATSAHKTVNNMSYNNPEIAAAAFRTTGAEAIQSYPKSADSLTVKNVTEKGYDTDYSRSGSCVGYSHTINAKSFSDLAAGDKQCYQHHNGNDGSDWYTKFTAVTQIPAPAEKVGAKIKFQNA